MSVALYCEPRVAKPSAAFSLTLNVRNLSGDSREFSLPSAQTHEFIASTSDGKEVWRFSDGMMFAQVVTPIKIAPGEVRVFKAAWNTGASTAGKYTVLGYFTGMENLRPSLSVEIRH